MESNINITVWVRPAMMGPFLVNKNLDEIEGIFTEMFHSDDFETLKETINTKAHIIEDYKNMDIKNYNTITISTKDGYEEDIEYKLVKMKDEEIQNLGEFTGW